MIKKVKKAIIPAAGLGTRFLPVTKSLPKEMLPLVDVPTIQLIVEEAVNSGIEEIIIVTSNTKKAIEDHFDISFELEKRLEEQGKMALYKKIRNISNMANIYYTRQKEPLGLGHAVLTARQFIGDEPFALLLGDEVYQNEGGETPLKQLIDIYEKTGKTTLGVREVTDHEIHRYGIIEKTSVDKKDPKIVYASGMVEKPSVEDAPSNLASFGRYVFSNDIFDYLETQGFGKGNEIQLADSINRLAKVNPIIAYSFDAIRYDVGEKLGFVTANIEYALKHKEIKDDLKEYIINLAKRLENDNK